MINTEEIKDLYPQPDNTTYLNTSSAGLVSKSSIEKSRKFNEELHLKGSRKAEDYYIKEIPVVRKTISKFIDVSIDDIALIPNFSYGLNVVIPSISKLKRVLLYRDDYPSLTIPFLLNDFDVSWLDSDDGFTIKPEDIEQSIIQNKIDILAISHVQYLTGFVADMIQLSNICKAHNVLLILDSTQSLGALPFSFNSSGVNICITSNYKWMNGGFGTGIMCIDSETQKKFPPKIGGFNSFKYQDKKWEYKHSINSYEPGHLNMAELALLKEAIDFKLSLGIENISTHNYQLLEKFTEKINYSSFKLIGPRDNRNRRNIVGIRGSKSLEKHLIENGIIVKMRDNIVRVGIHFYNTEKDMDRLLEVLDSYRFTVNL